MRSRPGPGTAPPAAAAAPAGRATARLAAAALLAALAALGVLGPDRAAAQAGPALQVATVTPPTRPPLLPEEGDGHRLSDADVARYGTVFALQRRGDWAGADRAIAGLADRRLMGHVLFQRYMHPDAYIAGYDELRDWLEDYADHPGADRVHALALERRPAGAAYPPAPIEPDRLYRPVMRFGVPLCRAARELGGTARDLMRRIERAARDGQADRGARLLRTRGRGLDDTGYDRLRGALAAGYYYAGDVLSALEHAVGAAERSGGRAEEALWIAGLAHWRLGEPAAAAGWFERLAEAECASAREIGAGAYWAARAHLRARNFPQVSRWLERAAGFPHTFYGQIARRALGLDTEYAFTAPAFDSGHARRLAERPAGARALALLQVGEADRAEAELLRLRPSQTDRSLHAALLALAEGVRMPRLALGLALNHQPGPGRYYDGGLFPLVPWRPAGGFTVDPALIHAVMREESHFRPEAVSYAGATGLMQLMPSTASAMAGESLRGRNAERLYDPTFNLSLGQAYIEHLLDYEPTGRDLIRVLVSYNAGPGNLLDWLESVDHGGDPLLFVESLPSGQARAYAEVVLSSFWIYRRRMGQPTPSLDDIAAGRWPRYVGLDGNVPQVAERPEAADDED
jgi:soluble lytic murein transglycosylase-like protein